MEEYLAIEVKKINIGEHAQRIDPDDEDLDALAASIRRIGVIEPLILYPDGDGYLVVAGHRRYAAAVKNNMVTVPAIVKDEVPYNAAEITFAENFFRKNLSPVELACALKDVLDNKKQTVDELSQGFHKSVNWVHNMVAIAGWPGDVQEQVHDRTISVSAASNLALVTDNEYRNFLLRNAVEQGSTARTTSAWLQAWRAMIPPEEAIQAEPVAPGQAVMPMAPQAPCFCCSQLLKVNEMSHVPVCGACVQIIRTIATTQTD